MKFTKFNTFFLFICLISLLFSCSKQEKLNPDTKNIQLSITGNTTDTLEYVIAGKVVATSVPSTGFTIKTLISITDNQQEIQIRKKGATDILQTRKIQSSPFEQSFTCYYDGTKLYDKNVVLKTKGYAGTSTLEFVLNGKVIGSGTGNKFPESMTININEGENQEVQIRKQGETEILTTKTIVSTQAEQVITFYYDGQVILDKIDLTPPANPANINVSAKFETTLPLYYAGPVDLVFFIRDNTGSNVITTYRLELPADGAFSSNIELPPLAAESTYTFRIFKSGTNDVVPYNTSNDVTPLKYNYIAISEFKAGSSQLLILNDTRTSRSTPAALKGTTYSLTMTDIAPFF